MHDKALGARSARRSPLPSLGALRVVTSTAPDIAAVEDAWTRHMGYRVVSHEPISADMASSWGAPAVAGRPALLMQPQNDQLSFLRFVEISAPDGFVAMTSPGWGALELVIQDPDALTDRLEGSPFRVLIPPHGVDTYPYLRALQAAGPAGEMLNLTLIRPAQPNLPVATSFVGQCYIVTLAVPDLAAAVAFFNRLGNAVSASRKIRLSLVNRALELPPETRHAMAAVTLADRTMIELDELSAGPERCVIPAGGLPAGLAVASFECPDLDAVRLPFLAPPSRSVLEPYRGRRSATIRGTAGELIELIEIR